MDCWVIFCLDLDFLFCFWFILDCRFDWMFVFDEMVVVVFVSNIMYVIVNLFGCSVVVWLVGVWSEVESVIVCWNIVFVVGIIMIGIRWWS